jgi:hypothetical protein
MQNMSNNTFFIIVLIVSFPMPLFDGDEAGFFVLLHFAFSHPELPFVTMRLTMARLTKITY